MTATPPSSADNPPTGPGPSFGPAPYGQYSASSGPSASVPLGPSDAAPYGQPGPGYSASQPSPMSYGMPAQGPYVASYADQYPSNPQPYAPQGYTDPNAAQYTAPQDYANLGYAQSQGYAQAPQSGQGYPQQGAYSAYPMAPMTMGTPLPTGLAVAAMVCGIVGVILSLCGAWTIALPIVGIVLGAIGLQKVKRGLAGGRGMAIAGIVTGAVGVAIAGFVTLAYIVAALNYR